MIGWLKLTDSQRKATIDQVIRYFEYIFLFRDMRNAKIYIFAL